LECHEAHDAEYSYARKYLISVICRSSYDGAVDYIRFLRQIAGICQHDGEAYGKAVEYLSVCSHPYARIFKGGPVRSEQVLETICSARKRDAPYYQHQCQHEKYRQTDSAYHFDTSADTFVHYESNSCPYNDERQQQVRSDSSQIESAVSHS